MNKHKTVDQLHFVLNGLMKRYKERVPDVYKITDAMEKEGMITQQDDIQNDHIAFRTMGVPLLGIQSLERIFLHYGYQPKDNFYFEQKKLNACWYAPPDNKLPRIFISELCIHDLSEKVRDIILSYTNEVKEDPTLTLPLDNAQEVDRFLHSALWRLPCIEDFEALRAESEYASWVIYNRYYLNHYTISVQELPTPYNDLAVFNRFLESIGIKLNNAGGKIKTSADGLLLQSSSVSKIFEATFEGGYKAPIAGSYVEFAERKVLPEFTSLPAEEIRRKHRRDGFETSNADKIFESTYTEQTSK